MIQKFINKLLGKSSDRPGMPKLGKRVEIAAHEHRIDPQLLNERAVDVVRTLKNAGYEAYIVGGAVRDLLLGLRPKDFDVATNATPEDVKKLFRRAFIIGRRFRIVHVVYGRGREHEVIEVSTFRAYLDSAEAKQISGNESTGKAQLVGVAHAVDESGRVLRDNVWGPQIEDAVRRDFTVNAMYYDPLTQVVVDYHKGFADIQKRKLRLIGDPATRYREDPVRLIRAVRFAAKLDALGFKLDKKTVAPIRESLPLLAEVPQSRLFDEMLKLLQTGHALKTIAKLREMGVSGIYPLLDLVVERADDALVHAALKDTDRRISENKGVSPSFLLACVLWSDVREGWQQRRKHDHPVPALLAAIDAVFERRIGDVSGRGRLAVDMREIWVMQPRFERRTGSAPFGLVEQPRFRAAFDFFRLRADCGEVSDELATWWEDFSKEDEQGREAMVAEVRALQNRPQRVKASPKRDDLAVAAASAHSAESSEAKESEFIGESPDGRAAPKRRRRRGGRGRKAAGSAPQ